MSYKSTLLCRLRDTSLANGGVYSTADLAVLLDQTEPSRVTEAIRGLIRDGLLLKVRRGLCVDRLNGYSPEIAGQRAFPPAYISTETALDRHGLCATGIANYTYATSRLIPSREHAVRAFEGHRFVYRHLAKHLFFGFKSSEGVLLAEPEKAALDFLYFTFKKQRSVIAPEDIEFSRLHPGTYRRYLRAYSQRGFQKFALSFLEKGRDAK